MQKLFQINTRNLLKDLEIDSVSKIPLSFWHNLKSQGFGMIWMLGVWQICDFSSQYAKQNPNLFDLANNADLTLVHKEFVGSCFAIEDYDFDPKIGSNQDFLKLKQDLNSLGFKLILDFIPNHFGRSTKLLQTNPEIFLTALENRFGQTFEVQQENESKQSKNSTFVYYGKDPHFEPWIDTVQLDYTKLATRKFMQSRLQSIANVCDGIRCDMAMLILPKVFNQTWKLAIENQDFDQDFWQESIASIKAKDPNFIFLAEVYWDLESQIYELGFDYVYNKDFLDSLLTSNGQWLEQSLKIPNSIFNLENHDEPRSTKLFLNREKLSAIAILVFSPGLQLYQNGQIEGNSTRLPIQLCAKQIFPTDFGLQTFYFGLFNLVSGDLFRDDSHFFFVRFDDNLITLVWKNQTTVVMLIVNFGTQTFVLGEVEEFLTKIMSVSKLSAKLEFKSVRKILYNSDLATFEVNLLDQLSPTSPSQNTNYSQHIDSKDFLILTANLLNS